VHFNYQLPNDRSLSRNTIKTMIVNWMYKNCSRFLCSNSIHRKRSHFVVHLQTMMMIWMVHSIVSVSVVDRLIILCSHIQNLRTFLSISIVKQNTTWIHKIQSFELQHMFDSIGILSHEVDIYTYLLYYIHICLDQWFDQINTNNYSTTGVSSIEFHAAFGRNNDDAELHNLLDRAFEQMDYDRMYTDIDNLSSYL
jgi:hypothetical protein